MKPNSHLKQAYFAEIGSLLTDLIKKQDDYHWTKDKERWAKKCLTVHIRQSNNLWKQKARRQPRGKGKGVYLSKDNDKPANSDDEVRVSTLI